MIDGFFAKVRYVGLSLAVKDLRCLIENLSYVTVRPPCSSVPISLFVTGY